jgi:hypothetical protein
LAIVYHHNKLHIDYLNTNYYNNYLHHKYHNIYSIITTITNKVLIKDKCFDDEQDGKNKIILNELGIGRMVIRIAYNQLHRVFNNSSFGLGGRYYGAYHLGMVKDIRLFMRINEKPVVELDYKALHPRMLYHMEKKECGDDLYTVRCESPDERRMNKLALLAMINAGEEKKAIQAMRNEFRKNKIRYGIKNKDLYPLMEEFKQAHKPINKYFLSGKGIELQNKDSQITENILNSFLKDGIPILPIHDSYLVEEKYEGLLEQRMVEEYQKVMDGFEPVIEKKKVTKTS